MLVFFIKIKFNNCRLKLSLLGNFIKFIMNPVFSEYKQCNKNYIETATFDELTKIISNKIKQNG